MWVAGPAAGLPNASWNAAGSGLVRRVWRAIAGTAGQGVLHPVVQLVDQQLAAVFGALNVGDVQGDAGHVAHAAMVRGLGGAATGVDPALLAVGQGDPVLDVIVLARGDGGLHGGCTARAVLGVDGGHQVAETEGLVRSVAVVGLADVQAMCVGLHVQLPGPTAAGVQGELQAGQGLGVLGRRQAGTGPRSPPGRPRRGCARPARGARLCKRRVSMATAAWAAAPTSRLSSGPTGSHPGWPRQEQPAQHTSPRG